MRDLLSNLPLPPGHVVGFFGGIVLDRLRPARLPGPRTAHRALGSVLVLAGGAFTGWAFFERRRGATGSFDLENPDTLVTSGPYAVTRHPMYVGWWLIHLGVGVWRGSGWVLATLPTAALAEHPGVLAEEKQLARVFGEHFERYVLRVPRYLPIG